jgi:uncharacterized protein YecE (DUF72 family)
MRATERLAFYCSRLPLAEIATTYRFPPTADLSRQWVARSPHGFRFDIRAWSLLTGAPTLPDSLWPDLQEAVRPELRQRRRLYDSHLPDDVLEECWQRFGHALRPLHEAQRLGVVVLQYPSWFSPKPETRESLAKARMALGDYRVAVELRCPKWFDGDTCEETLEWLEGHDLGFVCLDGPESGARAVPGVVAATTDVAVVRFVGRRSEDGEPWTWPYRYGDPELAGWVPRLAQLAASSAEVHVIMDNCWRSDAVDNALGLATMLQATGPPPPARQPPGGSAST